MDAYRAIAILSVMLFHYFSRWTPPLNEISLYPYKNAYNYFSHGNLGVNFFFIISGFVIFFTLENTSNFSTFWKKRLIRLFPSIAIASFFIFLFFTLFDTHNIFPDSHRALNLIPSLSFVSPALLNKIFSPFNPNLKYIDGSYWSLWVEIQFYLFSSIIYYINKKKFVRNFLTISLLLITLNYIFLRVQHGNRLSHIIHLPSYLFSAYETWIERGFDLVFYLPFFCSGALFYLLFKNRQGNYIFSLSGTLCFAYLILFTIYTGVYWPVRLMYTVMFLLFFGFIYIPDRLSILKNKMLTSTGEASYFLYLIHQHIGVLLIYSFGQYFLPFGFVSSLIVILILVTISNLYFHFIDKKISKFLKMRFIKQSGIASNELRR